MEYLTLNTGVKMPLEGFGVFQIPDPEQCERVVYDAIKTGYRLLDTAAAYRNERAVGEGIRESGLPRGEVFVTTKLWRSDWDNPRRGLEESLKRLDLDYVDLYLLHWPFKGFEKAWRVLEELQQEGLTRNIGVSNFKIHHLKELKASGATVRPQINQVECHPANAENELLKYCTERGIVLTAYSPLGGMGRTLTDDPRLTSLASYYHVTPAQLILRWNLQRGVAVIPKSVRPERIEENFHIWDFALTDEKVKNPVTFDIED